MPKINSMTGFGRVETSIPGGQLQWEIRSVNHRYLEIQMKLPDGFRNMEHDFRQLISEKVKRGKLDVALSFAKGDDSEPATSQMIEFASRTHQVGPPSLARDYAPAVIELAAAPIRVEQWEVNRKGNGIDTSE